MSVHYQSIDCFWTNCMYPYYCNMEYGCFIACTYCWSFHSTGIWYGSISIHKEQCGSPNLNIGLISDQYSFTIYAVRILENKFRFCILFILQINCREINLYILRIYSKYVLQYIPCFLYAFMVNKFWKYPPFMHCSYDEHIIKFFLINLAHIWCIDSRTNFR